MFVNKTRADKEETQDENPESESPESFFLFPPVDPAANHPRKIALFGEIEEEKVSEIIYSMISLKESGKKEEKLNPDDESCDKYSISYDPFEFIISTYGGSAVEMFGVYDTMRMIRDECEVHTFALGKVMSAGVLLLAAGTKGQRRVGANCRIMIHNVIGGESGPIFSLENEVDEVRNIQEQYVSALIKETSLTRRSIGQLLNKKINVYLNAKEAVEMGIADIIV